MRGTVAIMILGVPSVLAVGILTHQLPQYAAPIALAGASLSILAGLIARDVARPLGPERSRWLDGIAKASQNALVPEPTMALSASLLALKRMFRDPSATPELWRLEPAAVLSVDVAGYMHEAPAELPAGICELGLEEPERTLRHDTLKALEVHRPSVRPLLAWFEVHKAFCATVVEDEDGPVGFLLLPRGGRRQTLTIEEAHALRGLADRIGALFAINSTLARSRARESELVTRVGNLERDLSKASDVIAGQAERQREFAGTLARPARAHNYSAAAKLAFTELEQRARRAESTLLSAPVGVDVLAWAAAFHRSSPRANGPFICVDAPSLPVQSDGTPPPWHWAWGGTVFIRDIKCLATELQADLVDRLAREPAANTELAPPIVLGSINPPQVSAEVSASAGDPLFALFRRPPLALPALMERPEDLRSLVLDALARRGRGREPLGIERHALQLLMDHEWPGNERELYDVLERAAQIATGTLVDTDDLAAVGFRPAQAGSPAMPPNEGEPGGESVFPRLPSGPPRRRSRAPRARPRGS
jgi:hypothetical protein